MSWIIISSCAAIHLYTIGDVRQVFGESTGQSVPLTTEQSGNNTTVEAFTDSLRGLVSKSKELTAIYQVELGKWVTKENDNSTMISITDKYLPQFKELEKEGTNLSVPSEQQNIKESFINSINSEAASYEHFKNYLITGNATENDLSDDKFSLAFQYEQVYELFLLKNR